ncbi:hypothetical protein [Henriciella marina]|uniref:Uncharacterized protein n=1 Tax=Henriciella marina TaxID=453851 RepID=A0ABT4LUC0_9PROT|nr:hypothetical protein [Henriciella marina]MCZ4297956.1 hypothetical protein [Henriciella marina]
MDPITGLAASAAGGGLFGLIGTALGRVAGYFETRQRLQHETERWAHETKLLELQRYARAEETEGEIALAEASGRWEGLSASMAAEAAIGESYKWVNAVRGVTRPALTLLLWLIAGLIWIGADGAGRASIIETATFAATAATLWWFGDRGPRRGSGE